MSEEHVDTDADLGLLCTMQVRAVSRKFGVSKWEFLVANAFARDGNVQSVIGFSFVDHGYPAKYQSSGRLF